MFRWLEGRIMIGVLLILAGLIFLVDSLFPAFNLGGLFWAAAFGLGGLVFLSVFFSNRDEWWPIIPGFTLIGLALVVFLGEFAPGRLEDIGGGVFLGMIGLSFVVIYLLRRENWWAIIPAGVLITLAAIATLAAFGWDEDGVALGGLLFFGIGLTFVLVALLPNVEGRMTWAWIPAGILLAMGVLLTMSAFELMRFIWPVALILVGLGMVGRSLLRR